MILRVPKAPGYYGEFFGARTPLRNGNKTTHCALQLRFIRSNVTSINNWAFSLLFKRGYLRLAAFLWFVAYSNLYHFFAAPPFPCIVLIFLSGIVKIFFNVIEEKCLQNCFFGASPFHPLIAIMLKMTMNNVRNEIYGKSPIHPTGPCLFGQAYKEFLNQQMLKLVIGL